MPHDMPLLMRFLAKLVLDILPAALASVIGGFLFTQYHWGHAAAPAPASAQHAAASAEMMKLVRDEHALIVNYLNAQMAAEKARLAAEERASARATTAAAAGDVRLPAAAAAPHRLAVATLAAKPVPPREPPVLLAATPVPHAPIVIAQAEPNASAAPAAQPAVRAEDSLLAKTINIKDHVVTATQRAVAAIGGIPSWIAAVGDRIGGQSTSLSPPGRLVSATW